MLYDALSAIVTRAIRATADRFPVYVVKAALMSKCGDGGILTEKRRAGWLAKPGGVAQ